MKGLCFAILILVCVVFISGTSYSQNYMDQIIKKQAEVKKTEQKIRTADTDMKSMHDKSFADAIKDEVAVRVNPEQEGMETGDTEASEIEEKKFAVSGFIDVLAGYNQFFSKNAYLKRVISDKFHFSINNLNIYFLFKPYKGFDAFAEIRFTFAPTGKVVNDYVNNVTIPYDNIAVDQQGFNYKYGTITIERAYAEWNTFEFFKIRAGRFLTPYGIWSQDHGAPILTSIRVPFLVNPPSDNVGMPTNITGFEILGTVEHQQSGFVFEYAAYAGNNMTNLESVNDFEHQMKAIGGFVNFKMPSIKNRVDVELGLSAYRGERSKLAYTQYIPQYALGAKFYYLNQLDVIAAAHVKITINSLPGKGTFILQTEAMKHWVKQHNQGSIIQGGLTPMSIVPGFTNNYYHYFTYIQAEYQFLGWITPYFRYEYLYNQNAVRWLVYRSGAIYVAGLNIKPVPVVVLKFEYSQADFNPYFEFKNNNNDFRQYQMSVSMSF